MAGIIWKCAGWLAGVVLLLVMSMPGVGAYSQGAGAQLSYVSQLSGNDWHISLMDLDRRLSVDLTGGLFDVPARSRLPSWSPSGGQLAFVSDAGTPNSHIYLYDLATRTLRQLTEQGAYYTLPAWSPDGTTLAFGALPSVRQGIRLLDLTDGTLREVTPPALAAAQSPRFSPDGTLLSFVFVLDDNSRHVYVVQPDGENLRHLFGGTAEGQEPAWSPDGRYLAVTDRREADMVVHLIDVTTGEQTEVFRAPFLNQDVTWSPDGETLAFSLRTGNGSRVSLVEGVRGALASAVTPRLTTLDSSDHTYQTSPLYTPGGGEMVFIQQGQDTVSPELYLADIDGGRFSRLTYNAVQDWYPTWRPVP